MTSVRSPTKYLVSRCSISPIALTASPSSLSGTTEPTILRKRFSSLMKKNPMNITENRPMPKDPRADATEPTTDVIEVRSKAFLIQFTVASWTLKSRPSDGIRSINQIFTLSRRRDISDALNEALCRLEDTLEMILETTGMTWVMIARRMLRIRSKVMIASSQSGADFPLIRHFLKNFIIGRPRRDTTAASTM